MAIATSFLFNRHRNQEECRPADRSNERRQAGNTPGLDEQVDRQVASLVPDQVIEDQIVPRLLHSWCNGRDAEPTGGGPGGCAEHIAPFTDLVLLDRDQEAAPAYFDDMRARGYPLETLYLELLSPTARRLGEFWTEDLCGFADVTLGLCRLQNLLHLHGPDFWSPVELLDARPRAMLAPASGEQHSFGLLMVAEFFRRGGWDVWSGPGATRSELARVVHDQWFEVVGFSLSGESRAEELRSDIRAIRDQSRNRGVRVLVGGQAFLDHPDWVGQVGADDMAMDGRLAVVQAYSLVGRPQPAP